ncbi:MAG: hypothetical protein AABY44_03060 [Nitrospirota bacterium]
MRKILALLISFIFVATLSMTIGCPAQEKPKAPPAKEAPAPTPPPAAPAAPEKPAEAPPAAPEKK